MAFNGSNGNKFTFEQQMARSYWNDYQSGRTLSLRKETLGYPAGTVLSDIQYKRGVITDFAGREIRPIYIQSN